MYNMFVTLENKTKKGMIMYHRLCSMLSLKHTFVLIKKIDRYRRSHKNTHPSTNIFFFVIIVVVVISFFRLQNTEGIIRMNLKYFYLLEPRFEILFELRLF